MRNCRIYMNYPAISINIWLHYLSLVNCLSLIIFFKIMVRNVEKMLFTQDEINFPARIKTFCRENIPGLWNELVETGHLDNLCLVSKKLWVGLGRFGFRCWLGDFRNFIFSNAIKTVWCDNLPAAGYELVKISLLDHLCWVSKNRWVGHGRIGFRWWLVNVRKYIFFNIVTDDNMVPLYRVRILVRWCKGYEVIRD